MSALTILQALQSEVGSRRAGSDGEQRAQEWLRLQCAAMGLPVELDEFTFIASERYRPVLTLTLAAVVFISITLSFTGQPLVGGVIFFLVFLYINFVHKQVELRLARAKSHNIIAGLRRPISAYVADPDKGPAVLVCAHYDTPRNLPPWATRTRAWMRVLSPLGVLGIVLYMVFVGLRLLAGLVAPLGLTGPDAFLAALSPWIGRLVLILAAPFVIMILFSSLYGLIGRQSDSPGADDNGSGTALVLELARRLVASPPARVEVFFAWWGAEERGLFGSRQFVRRFHSQLAKDRLYLLNADCVGVGQLLTVNTGKGVLRRHAANPTTIERLERLAGRLGIKTIRAWESVISGGSSDHAEWVDRGYTQATSLLREDPQPLSPPARLLAALLRIPDANQLKLDHIHTAQDTVAGINPQTLEQTTDLAEAYIREIDATV